MGGFRSPYAGLVVAVLLPALFVLGLLLIPLGILFAIRRSRRGPLQSPAWPVLDLNRPHVRRGVLAVLVLTVVNVVILSMGSYGAVEHMDSPAFCGRTCHTPMQPQYEAWQHGPHSNVACVECHIGGGAGAFVRYKWNGVHQLVGVLSDRYPRPIPAPVKNLRPAAEICGPCHSPWKAHGDRARSVREYADDAASSETVTDLAVHVTRGEAKTTPDGRRHWPAGSGVHWHADPANRVEYASDEKREQILWIKVTTPEGTAREYKAEGATPEAIAKAERRVMDCVDCHNQPVHQFPVSAARAVDDAIAAGRLRRDLPFVRREGVRLLSAEAKTRDEGLAAVATGLHAFYAAGGGASPDPKAVDDAAAALQDIYQRAVYPSMKITFGTYRNFLGHADNLGCMRCHDMSHAAADGTVLPSDCDLCHTQP
ncbi:MAG TPA: NapC/NirT family cytochrome c [Verrucomicrobiae bacterium]|nr:NapC/NirT family cytochrome c [Verrucomicrobiae bacterium]